MSFLSEHKAGCTPINPCSNCQCVTFLREKLGSRDFQHVLGLLDAAAETIVEPVEPLALDTVLEAIPEYQHVRTHARNALKNDNVQTVEDLVRKTASQLHLIPNFGKRSLADIELFLRRIGHRVGELAENNS